MEKRSRRRTRDLVTQAAFQGLSENEIGCARISMMARSTNAPCKGRIQMRKTTPLHYSHSACNARPVRSLPVFPGKQTCAERVSMSQRCEQPICVHSSPTHFRPLRRSRRSFACAATWRRFSGVS